MMPATSTKGRPVAPRTSKAKEPEHEPPLSDPDGAAQKKAPISEAKPAPKPDGKSIAGGMDQGGG